MKKFVKLLLLGLFLLLAFASHGIAVQAETAVSPQLRVWASPGSGHFKEAQFITLQTNVNEVVLEEGPAKIFYTFNLNASLDDIQEYTEPIYLEQDQDIWFFAFVSPGKETKIQYESYHFLYGVSNELSTVSEAKNKIFITEVAPRNATPVNDWIEIKNYGAQTLDLDSWSIETRKGRVFLQNIIIGPEERLVLTVPLHNFYDEIKLYDRNHRTVDTAFYKQILPYLGTLAKREFQNGGGCFMPLFETERATPGKMNIFKHFFAWPEL